VNATDSDAGSLSLTRDDVATRAGVSTSDVTELIDAAVLRPSDDGGLTSADVRRVGIVQAMLRAGLPLASLSEAFRQGLLSLAFVAGPEYERFPTLSQETFEAASKRIGAPIGLLTIIREATGDGAANPHDRLRDDELEVVGFIELQLRIGFQPNAIERLLRAMSDSLRRIADAEAEWWRSQVLDPGMAAGLDTNQLSGPDFSAEMTRRSEAAMLAIYHGQQSQTWTANVVAGFALVLAGAGLHAAQERNPAICFLDITGYTRLTQERGDRAAADLAETLNRLVKRTSMAHGGRPVKWLGDGVMFHFPDPSGGVLAALEMVDGVREAGLPPAHVGLHAGPIVIQEGDYYGQTVNVAARIGDYARPGEVLVSDAVFEAARKTDGVRFTDIGAVELKGVSGTVQLHAAHGAG
jgi:class 3 adenylate cyclase